MNLLQARRLSVTVGGKQVCNDLNLDIAEHSRWGILGINGVGKSTLLHTLAGIRGSRRGQVLLGGQDLHGLHGKTRAQSLGVLFQHHDQAFPVTVLEAVLTGRHPHLGRWGWESHDDIQIALQALDRVGMSDFAERATHTLSGGEMQRVAIAALLAQAPAIALLDEPSNHLDLGQQMQMLELLTRHFSATGHAMLMVLHDPNLALRFCDHLLLLQENGDWIAGPSNKIATAELLSSLYGYPLVHHSGPAGTVLLPA